MHPCRVGDIRWPGQKRRAVGHKRQYVINRRLRVLPTCPEWLRLSRRARDTAATMLHHSRHRGESATKTVKFFVAHTVNYVICNNHTRIDWVLLNFTPVIQQNYHQPGRKFKKLWQALDITMVGVYHVQMWKRIVMIFLCDIFSGPRRMLKSLRNHRQPQRLNGKKWRIVGGRCWEKKKSFMAIKSIAIVFVPASRWD